MNYIAEINAFHAKMRRTPLSRDAQLLWFKLMDFANRLYWPDTFQVDNKRLMEMTNMGSKHTLIAARNELVDAGLLSFIAGTKGSPSVYRFNSVAKMEGPQLPEMGEPAPDDFLCEVKDDITTYFGYTEALGKEIELITRSTVEEFMPDKPVTKWVILQIFHYLREQHQDQNGQWIMSFPEERKRLMAYVFEQARLNDAMNWAYINAIYHNLSIRGIKTVEQAYDYDIERNQRKGRY